jgi:hypothetical protein
VLAEQVALALVQRAQELYDAKLYLDAKQLAVEAIVRSPGGTAAAQAKFVIDSVNTALGVAEPAKPEQQPIRDPIRDPIRASEPASETPIPVAPSTAGKHAILSGVAWGGVIGGLFADSLSTDRTTAAHVAIGAGLGAGLGGLAGFAIRNKPRPSRGDLALMDTLAGIGTVGGLTIGMVMQPVESEAYSVNAIIGAGSGLFIGYVVGPQVQISERRMLRVAGMAAAGGALPFLLYAGIYDSTTTTDERVVGALSTAGLIAGAIIGVRLTRPQRELEAGGDRREAERVTHDDAPLALVGRHSDGRWTPGGLAVQPLPRALAPQPGMVVPVLGAAF